MNVVARPSTIRYSPADEKWSAIDTDTYDGAPDAGPQIIGYGRTAVEAIADFHAAMAESLEPDAPLPDITVRRK